MVKPTLEDPGGSEEGVYIQPLGYVGCITSDVLLMGKFIFSGYVAHISQKIISRSFSVSFRV